MSLSWTNTFVGGVDQASYKLSGLYLRRLQAHQSVWEGPRVIKSSNNGGGLTPDND